MHCPRAASQDAPVIKSLIDCYVADGTLLARTEDFIAAHAEHFLAAEENGSVVGCVHLDEYAPSLSELRSLAVSPDAKGKGIGRALVLATEDLARRRGVGTPFAVEDDENVFPPFGFCRRHITAFATKPTATKRV